MRSMMMLNWLLFLQHYQDDFVVSSQEVKKELLASKYSSSTEKPTCEVIKSKDISTQRNDTLYAPWFITVQIKPWSTKKAG